MKLSINSFFLNYSFCFFLLFFSALLSITAQEVYYDNQDKNQVEKLLSELPNEDYLHSPVSYFAKGFLNTPYKASTLELEGKEQLVVNLRELDCTTYVETVLALYLTAKSENPDWNMFTSFLQLIRYRKGALEGYKSRLHYFSEWIEDNEQKGFIKETTYGPFAQELTLNLNYMTTHPDSYPKLKNNPTVINQVREIERKLRGKKVFLFRKKR